MKRLTTATIAAKLRKMYEEAFSGLVAQVEGIAAHFDIATDTLLPIATNGVLYASDSGLVGVFVDPAAPNIRCLADIVGHVTAEELDEIAQDALEQTGLKVLRIQVAGRDELAAILKRTNRFKCVANFDDEYLIDGSVGNMVVFEARAGAKVEGPKTQANAFSNLPLASAVSMPAPPEEEIDAADFIDDEETDGSDFEFDKQPQVTPAQAAQKKRQQMQEMLSRMSPKMPGVRETITLERDSGG